MEMVDFAPGMRIIIRDEEWMIKKIETNNLGNKTLYCVGISPLVKDREASFLTDLEQIQVVNPAEVKLVADYSPFYKRALLYLESQWRQQIPTDFNLHIGHRAAIEVIHLDAWVNQFLRESGFSAQIGYDDVINPLWEKAVLSANIDLPFETSFYEEEWNRIAIAQEALTLEKYVRATRNGRGTRLDRKKRMQVWKVFENYQNLMKENQIRDINTAMYESTKLLQSVGRKPRYASIIIDEGQDFSDNAYRLIRALAGEEHPNDIFIVGDSHQRIYRNHPTLSKCGINVRGRSSILKINYRTTEEIRKYAFALLNGISFDDLDENSDLGDKCQSLTHGEKPIVENFENANDEFDFLLHEVKKLKENGISLTDICVVARTKKLVDDYIALFTKAGICAYVIKRNKVDDRSFDGLRVATMHRVKGLEFKYVFIVAANSRIIPLPSAINKTDPVSEVESVTSEKCLLYVAMTRAQKGVYITSYGRKSVFLKS